MVNQNESVDGAEGLQETLKLCLDRIMSSRESAESRLFFPNGIESIYISSSLGLNAKGFAFDISIAGPNAKPVSATGGTQDLISAPLGGQSVVDKCKAAFPDHQFACNDFVITVAAALGVTLTGKADGIVSAIQTSPWNYLGSDLTAASQAKTFAEQDNHLVVAGMTADELGDTDGHVVVITPGDLVNKLYPHLYCGSTNQKIRLQDRSINYAFSKDYRDKVHYGWIPFT